ncbi:hypothetical protein N7462_011485 [Penicillium macrosclerotiorum]|uniref:uncharacterized protein n=1 Tax=Penicillium macrosclerotiorum TaxID=303699 RepID=UPI002546E04E|nr:uncharacterized protein N7462_011485 [Penicillium macrosclerotiorum]KAJ5664672.1 hypothetical protein N7462_011485 [Penicillium macrosclerotiorum]
METQSPQRPWLHDFRSSETFIVVVVSIAIFTDVFIYGMIVPIIPIALVDRAGARPEDAQSWVSVFLAVYGATLLIGSPLFGYFADRSGLRRLPFVIGLIALGASTALFVVARSLALLVVARALQGLSAAAVWVVGLAILADNVPPERVSEAMGHTTIALTWGFLLGPTIGGVMYERLGFHGTFAIPAGLIVVDVVLRFAMIEAPAAHRHDKSSLFSTGGDARSNPYGTFSRDDASSGYSAAVQHLVDEGGPLLRSNSPCVEQAAPENRERRATVLDLLRSPRLPLALLATIVIAVMFSALETVLPLYVMDKFHWSSSGAGLIFVASSVPSFAGVYAGKLINRVGARVPGAVAFTVAAVAWILLRLVQHNTKTDITLLITLMFIQGLATVVIEVVSMTEVSQAVGDYEAQYPGAFGKESPVGQAYALFNMAFAAGQLLGPILAGGMRIHTGWSGMTLVLGILCGMTAVLFGLFGASPIKRGRRDEGQNA